MTDTLLGPVTPIHVVRRAVVDVLQTWLPAALVDVARQHDIDPHTVPLPRSWQRVASWRDVPQDQLPVVFSTSPGVTGLPVRNRGQGAWQATWRLPIVAAVRGNSYEQTATFTSVYGAAIRTVLLQQRPHVEGLSGLVWVGERYDAMQPDQQRTLAGALVEFDATIDHTVDQALRRDAPPSDPFDPPPTRPTVTTATPET